MEEVGAGYTFFWSGRPKAERRDAGVAFAIRNGIVRRLPCLPQVLRRARRQHQDWFDDNDADISTLLAEKNGLHKAYMDLRTDATKAAFFRGRRLVSQRLREMQDAWTVRKAEEIHGVCGPE
ncbi:unnamed protein product [Schistocephalus solidus]|uniref:Uncharacterized protein n=1 Tax=Schistocephalus solidus TaxID=70667 RepID=A0A3P7D696_SCHSO|nr:unnamed protein product [Schistocephalus solidus]